MEKSTDLVANKEEFAADYTMLTLLAKTFTDKYGKYTNQEEMSSWAEQLVDEIFGNEINEGTEGSKQGGETTTDTAQEASGNMEDLQGDNLPGDGTILGD